MKKPLIDILSSSIRAKMFFFISLIIIIVVVTFVVFTDVIGVPFTEIEGDYDETYENAVTGINHIADTRKENIEKRILSLTSNVEAFVNSNLTKSFMPNGVALAGNQEFTQYLEDYRKTYNIFHNIQIADLMSGKIIASTREKDIGRDISGKDYITGPIISRCHHVCFALDETDNDSDFYISHVINVYSQPRYVVMMSVSALDFIETMSSNSQRGDTTETVLADNTGLLLINLKHSLPGGKKAVPLQHRFDNPALPMSHALDAQEGTVVGKDYRGVKVLAAYRYIPIDSATGWGLVVKRDYSDVIAPYYTKLRYVVVLIVCYLLAALTIMNILIRLLTRPISILKEAAIEIGKGRLDTVVKVNTKDELGQLAESFNNMARDLKDSHAELRMRKDFLQKVIDNTTNAVFSIDLTGRFLLANYKVSCITGYTENEVIGHPFSMLFDNDTLPEVNELFIKASVHGERVANYETELIRKDEVKRIIILSVTPIYDDDKIEMIIGTAEDITHRRELEYQIKQSETRLRAMFEQSPVGIAIIESYPKRFIMINQAYCGIVGYSHEEMLNKTFVEITHPDDVEPDLANMERLLNGEITKFSMEKRYICKDGSIVWVMLTCVPLWVSGEEPVCHLALAEDITAQKEMEEFRRINEKRLEAMVQFNQMADKPVNEIMDFVLEKSLDLTGSSIGFISFGNEEESEYTTSVYSTNVMKECAVNKEDLRFTIEHSGLWGEAVRQRRPVIVNDYETTTLYKKGHPEGHVLMKKLLLLPTFDGDRIVVVTAMGNKEREYTQTDVNQLTILMDGLWQHIQRKRMEDAIRAAGLYTRNLIETSLDPLVTITRDGKISDVNTAAESITGRTRDELIGTDFSGYFTDTGKAETGYKKVFDTGEVRDYELSIRHRNGTVTPVIYNASVYRDDSGNIIGVFAAARDISVRKRMEDDLRHFNTELHKRVIEETGIRQQNEQLLMQQSKMAAMGEMISLIVHQWKQPLNVISITAQDLGEAYSFGELNVDYLMNSKDIIVSHVEFMVKTADDFRRFLLPSREKVKFDVKKAVEELIVMFVDYFAKDNILLNIHATEGDAFPNDVTGYPNEFKQVVLNLINNARDAILAKRRIGQLVSMASDKIDINISSTGGKITIAISDTGGGIPEDVIDRIFDAHFTTKSVDKGTGIGLYMAKTIIETNMGWSLTARNIEGGAEFKIVI